MCYKTRQAMFEWEDILLVIFESYVDENKCIQYWREPSWDGHVSPFCEFLFLDHGWLGKMMGAKVVVEVNLEVTLKVVSLELEVLLEEFVALV